MPPRSGRGCGGVEEQKESELLKPCDFLFFSKAIKIEKGHSKDSTSLTDLLP